MAAISPFQTLIFPSRHRTPPSQPPSSFLGHRLELNHHLSRNLITVRRELTPIRTNANRTPLSNNSNRNPRGLRPENEGDSIKRNVIQVVLWIMEGVYILWLFLLPFAPGDPVWAISSDTINSLLGLSLNFFYVLPLLNTVGIHVIEAPVIHPMSEGLFNFVIGWTLMFAPLLFTDSKNGRYKGSLDLLWGFQMFLTNTFLIPYMAIRLNKADKQSSRKPSKLGTVMIQGANIVGLTGGVVCVLSILWGLIGRADSNFGSVSQRLDFLLNYLGSERLAYAFIWDIVLYAIFQPWLIGDNLENVPENRLAIVNYLRFVPVIGLVAYLLCLNRDEEMYIGNKSLND